MDFKERFKEEYHQLDNRIIRLQSILDKWDNHTLEFEPLCPRGILDMQLKVMKDYRTILQARAAIEKIEL